MNWSFACDPRSYNKNVNYIFIVCTNILSWTHPLNIDLGIIESINRRIVPDSITVFCAVSKIVSNKSYENDIGFRVNELLAAVVELKLSFTIHLLSVCIVLDFDLLVRQIYNH